MSTEAERAGRMPALGTFSCGLSVIVAAAVLNLAYDRRPGTHAELLPPFLARTYEQTGKVGVTLALVTGGMSMILLGFVFPRSGQPARPAEPGHNPVPGWPVLYPPVDEPDPAVSGGGKMVLRTWKYLPQHGLSGSSGVPPARRT